MSSCHVLRANTHILKDFKFSKITKIIDKTHFQKNSGKKHYQNISFIQNACFFLEALNPCFYEQFTTDTKRNKIHINRKVT